MAKAAKPKKKAAKKDIVVKTNLSSDQLLKAVLNTSIKKKGNK